MGADSGECIWVFATVHSCREHVGPQFTAWGASHCLWGAGGGRGSVPACRPPGRRPRTVGLRPRTAEAGVGRHLGGPRRRVPPGAREGPFCSPPDVRVVLHTQLDREQHEQVLARSDSLSQRQSYWLLQAQGPRPGRSGAVQRHGAGASRTLRAARGQELCAVRGTCRGVCGLGAWEGARWAVQQAGAVSPQREGFKQWNASVRTQSSLSGRCVPDKGRDGLREYRRDS